MVFSFHKDTFFSARGIVASLLLALLLLNLAALVYLIFNRALHPDEFQHMHIAWNMYFNDLVIYRDFWDHHGVFYALVNFFFLTVLKAEASFDLYYLLRLASLAYVLAYLYLTYKIALQFLKSKVAALAVVSVLSCLYHFQTRAVEIRPDMLQNVFWLGAVYLLVRYLHTYSVTVFSSVGLLLGLAVATNLKAIGAAGLVFLFLVLDLSFERTHTKEKVLRLFHIGFSFLCVHGAILLYFASVGAIPQYIQNALYANFLILRALNQYYIKLLEESFLWNVVPTVGLFLVTSLAGIVAFSVTRWRGKTKKEMFLVFVTIGCLLTAPFGVWGQYYLLFAPFLAIFCIYAIRRVYSLIPNKFASAVMTTVVSFALLVSLYQEPSYDPQLLTEELLQMQMLETNTMLGLLDREEIVGFFWNEYCGGYVFNRDVQYYAIVDHIFRHVYFDLEGSDVLSGQYIEALKEKEVRFIVGHESYHPIGIDSYVNEAFLRVTPCLLMKADAL